MATSTLVHQTVFGGRHDGASFIPGNGITAKRDVEGQIVQARPKRKQNKRDAVKDR